MLNEKNEQEKKQLLLTILSEELLYFIIFVNLFNPLTPGTFCQNCVFFDILVVLRLDLGQISFSLVENTFAT